MAINTRDTLHPPVEIAPNLCAGVRLETEHGLVWITCGYSDRPGTAGRTRYRWTIIWPDGKEHSGEDLQSGAFVSADLTRGLADLLSFLSACGESYAFRLRNGRGGENADLFPLHVAEWASRHVEELQDLHIAVEESGGSAEHVEVP